MKSMSRSFLSFLIVLFALGFQPGFAEGLVVPRNGGVTVFRGDDLSEVRQVSTGSEQETPSLAAHPAAPVLASLSSGELTFWNLPSFTEASRHKNDLFLSARGLAFSPSGEALYILSESMKAVIVFDLNTSKVVRMIPVPGGIPKRIETTAIGLLVEIEKGVSLLSYEGEGALLTQFRYPETLQSAVISDHRIFLARSGESGLDSYEAKSGRALGPVFSGSHFKALVNLPKKAGLVALTTTGTVEAWNFGQTRASWTYGGSGGLFDLLLSNKEGTVVYALARKTGNLVALDSASGKELAMGKISTSVEGAGRMAVFSDLP